MPDVQKINTFGLIQDAKDKCGDNLKHNNEYLLDYWKGK
jgi:hypothetical protein